VTEKQAGASSVLIHQLSKGTTQQPFSKAKGEAQLAAFHPSKPFLFVASQNYVRVYHLIKQQVSERQRGWGLSKTSIRATTKLTLCAVGQEVGCECTDDLVP